MAASGSMAFEHSLVVEGPLLASARPEDNSDRTFAAFRSL
jgi:hypothetical protein